MKTPCVLVVVDAKSHLMGAIQLDVRAVRCNEAQTWGFYSVGTCGWDNTDFGSCIDKEVCARDGVPYVE